MTFRRLKHAAEQPVNPNGAAIDEDLVVDVCNFILDNIELDGDATIQAYGVVSPENTVTVTGKLAFSKIQQHFQAATPELIQVAVNELNDPNTTDTSDFEKEAFDSFKDPNMKDYGDAECAFSVTGQEVTVAVDFTNVEADRYEEEHERF